MRKLTLGALALCILGLHGTGQAGVTTIGSSSARLCYMASESKMRPRALDLAQCDQALQDEALVDRDIVATHVNRGIIRSRLGDLEGALADFDAATRLDAQEPEAYLNKGLTLVLRANKASSALPLFEMALSRSTRRPELAYYGRAVAHEELGNLASAYADYVEASRLDPKWQAPKTELARFSVRR